MVVTALDHVPHCYTSKDGEIIRRIIHGGLAKNQEVILSFSGVNDVPSSFVNAALVSLLEDFSFDYIRNHLTIVNSNTQINDMIRRRFKEPENRKLRA